MVNLSKAPDSFEGVVTSMALAIQHRGPDDAGAWVDSEAGVALGHRRLSIIDLSPAGHQPMASASGRFVIALNGEIYNHLELRAELASTAAAPAWRGHSDTETLLSAFEQWGVEVTLTRTVGMFAMALWDKREQTLHLARDRFGEKPLYYGWADGAFVFGSELKALRTYPGFANPVCREALLQYFRFTYVPAPRSIYQGTYKLEPGCLLSIHGPPPASAPAEPLRPPAAYQGLTLSRWWSLAQVVEAGVQHPLVDEHEALETLDGRLRDAVRLQSLADVPLGAFLSGGVDSSAIVALMQAQASRPVKTFTIGFEEAGFDESPHARAVAQHLGTEHSEMFVSAAEARAVIGKLPAMYDEPFADSSQIPTHLVCQAARRQVTVALSGDAGDELFGGYNRYFWGPRIWNRLAWLPFPLRRALGAAISGFSVGGWDSLGGALNRLLPGTAGIANVGDKAHKLAARLGHVRNPDDLYLSLVSEWPAPELLVRAAGTQLREPSSLLADDLPNAGLVASSLRMMYQDSRTYLPDDILCKVDRAAMAVSLETRVPFLDHRVAELAWQLPLSMKIRGNEGKWALRQILYKYVPRELIERPKAGFAIPVGQWLRGPLRDWAEALLDESRLTREGYLNPAPIREKWLEHLSGRHDWTPRLWSVLMFQAWLEANS
jgi:asparagine synthase (glutamine-hydrolysing)